MTDINKKHEKIIESNTNFMITVNRIAHEDFTIELNRYLIELKELMELDTVVVLQPLILDSRLESFISNSEKDYSDLVLVRNMNIAARVKWLNSFSELTEFGDRTGTYFPMFDITHFKQVIAYPIINKMQLNLGNGGIFFLNKEKIFDLNTLTSRAISIVSETIALAYNSYRKKQLYDSSYSIFQSTQESLKRAVCIYKAEGIVVFANKYFYELIGKTEEEAFGKNIMDILELKGHKTINDLQTLSSPANKKLADDKEAMYAELIKDNGQTVNVRKFFKPVALENRWYKMLVVEDITQELENIDSIELSGYFDSLTGLKNRNYYEKDAVHLLDKKNHPIAVIVGDINGLKLMNDIFGHTYGDLLLKEIASILTDICKDGEVYRVGGDEFYIFLKNFDADEVNNKIEKINKQCRETFQDLSFIGISLGYYIVRDEDAKIDSVIRKAENEMYYIKSMSSEEIKNKSISSLKTMYMKKFTNEIKRVERMCQVAEEFSSYLKLRDSELADVCYSLELIDIGKVSINSVIFEGDLLNMEDEFENMKKHCRVGYKIASLSYETSHLARVILNHHENWDGTGFPQGINGKSIPFLSRIIRLIEFYDHLVFNNTYITEEQIIEELEAEKGKLFDPLIVDEFILYLTENKIKIICESDIDESNMIIKKIR